MPDFPLKFPALEELQEQIRFLETRHHNLLVENAKLREILQTAETVRNRQKQYFGSRTKRTLLRSIDAENKLDLLISRY